MDSLMYYMREYTDRAIIISFDVKLNSKPLNFITILKFYNVICTKCKSINYFKFKSKEIEYIHIYKFE